MYIQGGIVHESLIAQKWALCAYTAEYDLTGNQWGLLGQTVAALARGGRGKQDHERHPPRRCEQTSHRRGI